MKRLFLAASLIALIASPAMAQATRAVERNAVEAHMNFVAGEELQGRGSATRDEAFAAGCDDYHTKPIDFDGLVRKIQSLLSRGEKTASDHP